MPRFTFQARDRFGAARSGVIDRGSIEAVTTSLRNRNWVVVSVRPEGERRSGPGMFAELRPANWMPARMVDVELGMRQLSVMLSAGLPLLDAIRLLRRHADRRKMGDIWQRVADDVLAGETMAAAMRRHPRFPPIAVQLTRVGEETGELQSTQRRAAELLEYRRRLRNQIMSALAYPVVVLIAAVGVAFFMVFSVIPQVQKFLVSLGKKLPPITQLLIDCTNFITAYGLQVLVALAVIVVLVFVVRMRPEGRVFTDRMMLKIPLLGKALRLAGTATLTRNLQTLLQSGVSLLDSLKSIESLLTNRHLSRELAFSRNAVIEGGTLAQSLAERGAFQPMLLQIVSIGESSGRLDDVLGEAASYFEEELSRMIRLLAALVEPVTLLMVGGIVGFVYIAFFMALFAGAG